ncbi:hypothetical protein [Microbacterium sp. zg.B96]|uniref:hypothetical protein n=1 Tax=Microbacterium sp. zg.B96 TaxID=2969409 RepID=UPI00214C684D|nr:hypothetical protein [Microbacterium sp. zg.B96]MCR2783315.1 hypothetical protein [Microbacterium sp. zg.B96]
MRTTSLFRAHGCGKPGESAGATRQRRRCARAALATLAVAAAAALAGCAPDPAPTLPEGVRVTLQQLRSDVADRTAQVRVANGSDTELLITRLELHDDWFDGPAVRDRDSTITPGRTVDLRIDLPPSACEGEPDADARESVLVFTMRGGTEYRVPTEDSLGFTGRLHERECLAHDAAAVASLSWGAFTPSAAGEPATLQLDIAPAGGDGSLRIVEVLPTNLLRFADVTAPLPLGLEVDGRAQPAPVDVPLVPSRCDPHAVQEDKRGTVFTVAIETESVSGTIEVPASPEQRGKILSWVAAWCRYG